MLNGSGFLVVCIIFIFISSDCEKNEEHILPNGKYLADSVYFPQDTLIIKKFTSSDSTTKEKLLVVIENDSIFLGNYNFNGWYGKWFCDFHAGKAKFEGGKLYIHANMNFFKWRCANENPWRKIEYQLQSVSANSYTLVKVRDTSNCERTNISDMIRR